MTSKLAGTVLLSMLLSAATISFAQPPVRETVTTITSAGTVSEFGPDAFMVRSETSPEPLRYSYSKTTTYTDENGNPVSVETVRSGVPVTVHYTKVGDRFVATRVVVRKPVVADPAVIVEKKTTTTTTTTRK